METGGFQEPLTCPPGLCQAPQVPKDPNDTGEQPWGGSIGSQAWESGADLLLANGIPRGDFRLHGLVCPTPNRRLVKGAAAQCQPGSHQN